MLRIEHYEEKWLFPFVEYLPINDNAEELPLIIFLHGAGERGRELWKVDVHGPSKYIKDKDIKSRFILPLCPENTAWAFHIESILKFINQITDSYSVDTNRIYLTGLSMGGYGTWLTAMAKPDIFAAIAPCCGGGMAWNASVLKMPIWTFHGVKDDVVSVTQTDEMVESLIRLGADVKYSRIENVYHNVWDYTYDKELIDWLLSKRK